MPGTMNLPSKFDNFRRPAIKDEHVLNLMVINALLYTMMQDESPLPQAGMNQKYIILHLRLPPYDMCTLVDV